MGNEPKALSRHPGVRLVAGPAAGICRAEVLNEDSRYSLPWDRFARLKATSDHIRRVKGEAADRQVLDVGGFDGALAMFLPGYDVHVADPATTGGSGNSLPVANGSYDVVVSIDAIEHVPPPDRRTFLQELSRACRRHCFINFPNPATLPAQKVVLSVTGNALVEEHVELGLPDKSWVQEQMKSAGFSCLVVPHSSTAVWVAQYTLQNLAPEAGAMVADYLVRFHGDEASSIPLYYLFICERTTV